MNPISRSCAPSAATFPARVRPAAILVVSLASMGHAATRDTPDCAVVRAAMDRIETSVGMRQYDVSPDPKAAARPERLVRVLTHDKQYVRMGGDNWVASDREEARRNRKSSDYSSFKDCKAAAKEDLAGVATTRYDYLQSGMKAQLWVGTDGLPRRSTAERHLMGQISGTSAYRYEYGAFDPPK